MTSPQDAAAAAAPGCSGPPYGAEYYASHCGPQPYERNAFWLDVFGRIADQIARSFTPRRVFDAGCAMGFLVEKLWELGIEAHGRDVSAYAISRVRDDVRSFCSVGSITAPIEGRYDLITCIEVLEHMPEAEALQAIAVMAAAADRVLFSSSPTDFTEPTHVNVRPPAYWLARWAEAGFTPSIAHDAGYVAPHAFLVERSEEGRSPRELMAFADRIHHRVAMSQLGDQLEQTRASWQHARQSLRAAEAAVLEGRELAAERLERIRVLERDVKRAQQDAVIERQKAGTELQNAAIERQHAALELQNAVIERQTVAMEAEREAGAAWQLRHRVAELEGVRAIILSSTSWRITAPLRWAAGLRGQLPALGRKAARVLWWTATLQLPERLRERRAVQVARALTSGAATLRLEAPGLLAAKPATADALLRARFEGQEALRIFPAPDSGQGRRVTIVTDSINAGSLYGGVGTALILAVLLCKALGATLRLVTRTEPPQPENIGQVLAAQGIAWDGNIELIHSPPGRHGHAVPVAPGDVFLTTSWWTTWATRLSVPDRQIVYLLQEDERMFYPLGDDHLRATETLSDPALHYVVNSRLLLQHLTAEGMAPGALAFEPAFPSDIYAPREQGQGKHRFFFYARPNNVRNLYWRGLEAISAAIEQDVFDLQRWEFYFVGHGGQQVVLPRNVSPHFVQNLAWSEYAELVRSMDAGLSLMYTPHPSYPPLDLAASGAVVVTNRFGLKQDLSDLSPNIICAEPTVAGLVQGLRDAVQLCADTERRRANAAHNGMARDWQASLAPVVEAIRSAMTQDGPHVHR